MTDAVTSPPAFSADTLTAAKRLLTAMVRAPDLHWTGPDGLSPRAVELLGPARTALLADMDTLNRALEHLLAQPGIFAAIAQRKLTEDERLAVFLAAGGQCAYCPTVTGLEDFHVDHVWPVAQGGSDDPENLACACGPCNQSKGARTPQQWKGALA